jgi:LysR family glycine cleavage system transcriptional activator
MAQGKSMSDFRRLPNLAALRAFEAAARHQNFSRASEEIHVTHGAISHQVRSLEEELGVQLFARHGKRIAITDDGQAFADAIRKALEDIAAAAQRLQSRGKQKRLGITSLSSFAARWLSPRMGRFIELYPDLEVSLESSNHIVDFAQGAIDLAIRFGNGGYAGLVSEHLLDDIYYPVVSPHFNGGKLPRTPRELVDTHALLRCEDEPWEPWFRAVGLDDPEPSGGLIMQDASILARAAVEGHGIALARHHIVQPDIAAGALVRLPGVSVPCPKSYYLVYPPNVMAKPQAKAFRDWLLAEIEKARQAGLLCDSCE